MPAAATFNRRFTIFGHAPRMTSSTLPGPALIGRFASPRELKLKRSWVIGGYGRPLPRGGPSEDARALGRRLQRVYETHLDQIVLGGGAPYELRSDQIIEAPRSRRVG